MHKKYDVFLIDADNTLFDYDKAEMHALHLTLDIFGYAYDADTLSIYRKINSKAWDDFERGIIKKTDINKQRFTAFFAELGVNYQVEAFADEYMLQLGKGNFLIDGAETLCKSIVDAGKQIYIITNGILSIQTARLSASVIKPYISDFFVSEHVGFQKPDLRYFNYVLNQIPPVNYHDILVIGDSLTADIQGAVNANLDSCWYNHHKSINDANIVPTYVIENIAEAIQFV